MKSAIRFKLVVAVASVALVAALSCLRVSQVSLSRESAFGSIGREAVAEFAKLAAAARKQSPPRSGVPALPQMPMYFRAFQALVADGNGGRRFLTPAEVVDLGGPVIAGGTFTGIPIDVPRTLQLRDDMAEARRIAAVRGVEFRMYVTTRPDHYVELAGASRVPGFRDEWIPRTPLREFREDVRRFESEGWSVEPVGFVSRNFMDRMEQPGGRAPHYYGRVDSSERKFKINGVLVDLRDPAYRSWQISWLRSLVEELKADGIAVGIKTGWHAFPMFFPKASPSGRFGGPLSDTPYGPGEYEAAMTAWILEASTLGLPIIVQDSTPGSGGPGAWFSEDFIRAVEGRLKPLPLPGQSSLSTLFRRFRG